MQTTKREINDLTSVHSIVDIINGIVKRGDSASSDKKSESSPSYVQYFEDPRVIVVESDEQRASLYIDEIAKHNLTVIDRHTARCTMRLC